MIFGKKEKNVPIEEKLKEIEEKVKGLGKVEQSGSRSNQQPAQTLQPAPSPQKAEEEIVGGKEVEAQAPLFIKVEKYKTIVSSLMQLKALLISLKNSLVALGQIERTRMETYNTIAKNLEKINEKIAVLEKELVKPIGFPLESPILTYPAYEELESVQTSIANLKAQIEQLKAQLESL